MLESERLVLLAEIERLRHENEVLRGERLPQPRNLDRDQAREAVHRRAACHRALGRTSMSLTLEEAAVLDAPLTLTVEEAEAL